MSDEHLQNSGTSTESKTDSPVSATDAASPASEKSKMSFREKVSNIPGSIDNAIAEGKGNTVIEGIQDIIYELLTAVYKSCRLASLQMCMLTDNQKKTVSKFIYLFALILAIGSCLDLLISFSFESIIFAIAVFLAAYFADIILNSAILKKATKQRAKPQPKPKQKQKKQEEHHSTDDDIL